MTLAVPTHLVDTMGSAAAIGVEAAGHLLQEVGSAVSGAAAATSDRARTLSRLGRPSRSCGTGRSLVILGVLAAVAALVVLGRRSKSRSRAVPDVAGAGEAGSPSPSEAAVGTPKPVAAASEEVLSDDAGR